MPRTITALQVQKHNPQRINVYLDGEYAFGLARIVAAWLHVGEQLSDEKAATLQTEDAREAAYQRALHLLDHRERSRAEVVLKLRQNGVDEEIVGSVLERLERSGLLDDQRFARNWASNRSEFRPRGRRALAYELGQKGVQKEVIEKTLENLDEETLAYQAAHKHSMRWSAMPWLEFRQKMYSFLARRGFSYDTCSVVVRRVWAELQSERPAEQPDEDEVD